MKLYFITLALLIPFAASFCANCEFKDETWSNFGPTYGCNLKGITSETPNTMVDDVHGSHLSGKTNTDVNSIWIENSTECLYFPKGFDNFFSNIKGLGVIESGLKTITQDDLRPFPKLTSLWVYSNKLTTVEPNLFVFNTQLTFIDFGDNRIRSISADLFDYFENLEEAKFNQNICIEIDGKTPGELKALTKEIFQKCQNGFPTQQSGCQCQHLLDKIALLETNSALQQKEVERLKAEIDGLTTFSK